MASILPNTLSFRLTLLYAIAFSFFLLAAFGFAFLLVKSSMNNEINDDLSEDIIAYRNSFRSGGIEQVINEINQDIKAGDALEEFVNLFDAQGQPIFSSGQGGWEELDINNEIISKIAGEMSLDAIYFETQGIPAQEIETRIAYSMIGPDVIIQIGESLQQISEILELLIYLFLITYLVVIPPAFVIGWFFVRRAVSGIEKVSYAATEIRNGNLDCHVDVSGQSSEIQNLVDTFNSMTLRIKELITEMREMIDNIAHDLRTPLGRIRMISEMTISTVENDACKTAAANTLEQCDKLLQYINGTLDVSEVEAGISSLQEEDVDISAVTCDACELFETIAEVKNIKFTTNIIPGCIVQGNKQNLQRMIANILDNAIKYTPVNGKVSVNLDKNYNNIQISITDTGIGIPVSDQQRVFERFFRCDQSRQEEGCGLGLSFSKAVARYHNGDIALTSTLGAGSIFVITIPSWQK